MTKVTCYVKLDNMTVCKISENRLKDANLLIGEGGVERDLTYSLQSFHAASHAGYLGKLLSRPITVVKKKKTKRSHSPLLRLFIRRITPRPRGVGVWQIIKQKRKLMRPACEAGGLIDYSLCYFHY